MSSSGSSSVDDAVIVVDLIPIFPHMSDNCR